jgi:hypothetical protein
MDKRSAKCHKRQVIRARERGGVSGADLRTPEQIQAAGKRTAMPAAGREEVKT